MRLVKNLASGLLAMVAVSNATADLPTHGLAMHGDLRYPSDFAHFEYANPDAPKGGEVRLSAIGSFDSLHPFILKGRKASQLGLVFDTLTERSDDEAFSRYGLVAESMEVPEDRSWVVFNLRPEARFHDGSPITAEDVAFSLEVLKTQGHPFYRSYFGNVTRTEILGRHRIKFSFEGGTNRELPLIVGELPILPKAWWETREFDQTMLDFPLGSGPYRIKAIDPGRSITYERVKDYWARDLPVNKGRYNYDEIHIDYYRDATIALEGFKAGEFDFRQENVAKNWATAYDIPAVKDGRIIKEGVPHELGTGMQAFVFNTRREVFADKRVRQALGLLFDFEWTNKTLFFGAYTRSDSYFSNTELASGGLPEGEELKILERFRGQLPKQLFTEPFSLPVTNGDGNIRPNIRQALRLLKQAGWSLKDKKLVDPQGRPMRFEILLVQPTFERVVLPFKRNLEKLGIDVSVRTVDTSQYKNRLDAFDFDMAVGNFGQSLSPGNEQRDFWSSAVADKQGSRNLMGIKNPVVDELIELVISAPDRESLLARTRALDRVLLWHHYVIPNWHIPMHRIVYWDKFDRPATPPRYALGFDTWWVDAQRAARLNKP